MSGVGEDFRRFLKNQRQRVEKRLAGMERRILEARCVPVEEWEAEVARRRQRGKKPSLDYYDARWQ